MNSRPPSRWRAVRWIAAGLGTVLLWTLWLGLTVLLGIQIWWLRDSELAVPDFVLRRLETRLAENDLRATFGRTLFDPTGRILVQDVRVFSPSFADPLITADYLLLRADPVLLYAGVVRPIAVDVEGVTLLEPALYSASGRTEPVVDALNASVEWDDRQLNLQQLTAQVGPFDLTATGLIPLPRQTAEGGGLGNIADFIAHQYPRLSAELSSQLSVAESWDRPRVQLTFSSTADSELQADVEFSTPELPYAGTVTAEIDNLRARARLPLNPLPSELEVSVSADSVNVPGRGQAQGVRARLTGDLDATTRKFAPTGAELAAARVAVDPLREPLTPVQIELTSATAPLTGHVSASWYGLPQGADFVVSPETGTASVQLAGWIGDGMIDSAARLTQPIVRSQLQLEEPVPIAAEAEIGPGWKPQSASARFDGEAITARGVHFDEARGRVEWDGKTLRATDAYLRHEDSFARGSYTMDTTNLDFRFLLTGRLRPSVIDPWFREWWQSIFTDFDFTRSAPAADIDSQGRWGDRYAPVVFVTVDATDPAVRGVDLDEVHTTLFIRPQYIEGRSVTVKDAGGTATGQFTSWRDPFTGEHQELNFATSLSDFSIEKGAALLGDAGASIIAPFKLENPPELQVSGTLRTDAHPEGSSRHIQITGKAAGTVEVYDFPVSDPEFVAQVEGDDVTIEPDVAFAEGRGTGTIHLTGPADNRQVDFDLKLEEARLGSAARTLEAYSARRRDAEPPETSAYIERAGDVRVNLSAQAKGPANNLLQLQGTGQADLNGAGLGEVRLLGGLSQIITLSSIRFNHLQTNFQIDGPRLVMPDVRLTGNSAAIDARGVYNLAQRTLDFSANFYPFGESRSVLQLLDVITRPLSDAVQIRLTGTLDRPTWVPVPSLLSSNPLNGTGGAPATQTSPTAPAAPAGSGSAPAPTAPAAPENNQ